MTIITVGAEAIDRSSSAPAGYTHISKDNPANASGRLTSIEIWAFVDMSGLRVGTFIPSNGDALRCRDSEAIAGSIIAGSKVIKAVSIAVEIGDYIGFYFTLGSIERDTVGYAGYWYKYGEYIDPDDEAEYGYSGLGYALSLKGIGVTAEAPTVTTQAVDDIGTTTATGNGTITDTGGENCDHRGIVYGKTSKGDPGNVAPGASGYDGYEDEADGFGTGAFTRSLTSLDEVTTYYARAYAHNSEGYSYGGEVSFRTLFTARSGTALLGVKGTASGVRTAVRSDTSLLGLLSTGSRVVSYARSDSALLGLLPAGVRTLVLTRSATAYLGLKTAGVRTMVLNRADTALLGLKTTGAVYKAYVFVATALLGLKTTGVRTLTLTRAKTALLGLFTSGSRVILITRADTALLGLKATGTRVMIYAGYTAIALLDLKPTASRLVAYTRTYTSLLGLKTTGVRIRTSVKSATAILGLAATGTMGRAYTRVATALLGLTATATRTLTITRASTALVGLKGAGAWAWIKKKLRLAPYAYSPRREGGGST